uniref:LRAT domain-containing protein n=1 Tax=Oryzias melastigma TaxID=30732 RepID=A0A3B3CM47_ORYME
KKKSSTVHMQNFREPTIEGIRFMHFAVYVGDADICGKKQKEVNNYLDDYTDPSTGRTYCKGDDKDIIERITETYENWGVYGILHYNCEHLATYVRYGVKIAVQVSGQRVINSIYLFKKHFVCPVFTKIIVFQLLLRN